MSKHFRLLEKTVGREPLCEGGNAYLSTESSGGSGIQGIRILSVPQRVGTRGVNPVWGA